MSDPYKILGVNPNDSDDKIKEAYRNLAKKYHPDNYNESPLKDIAEEKMQEINSAFDQIMNERRTVGGSNNSYSTQNSYSGSSNSSYNYNNYGYQTSSNFSDIRKLIQSNRIVEAEELLDGVPVNRRDAEWQFLKGTVCYSRGWVDDAMNYFSAACRMDPNNVEYRAALNRISWQRQGNFGTPNNQYRTYNGYNAGGCTPCDICQGLICADCCCECMGGDLINCC